MGLDVTVKEQKEFICPHCGKRFSVMGDGIVDSIPSGGRQWYDYLKSIGYYTPYEERTASTPDWYGKDMDLEDDQARELAKWVSMTEGVYNSYDIESLIARALLHGNRVVINADW
jgi:hypothetical protein